MSGLLATSLSGLMAAQRSLETVNHNIANVNTEGYSRQTTDLGAVAAQLTGDGYVGQGVSVSNVKRSYDQFIEKQLSASTSAYHDADRFHQLAGQVDNLVADSSTSITPVLTKFFNAVSGWSTDPASIPSRQVVLSQAESLTQSLNALNNKFEDMRTQSSNDITSKVNDINTMAKGLADLNQRIVESLAKGQGLRQPNDLLDKRDALLTQLSEMVNVNTVQQKDGSSTIMIGNGQVLVIGARATEFVTFPSPNDTTRMSIGVKMANGTSDITSQITGGSLAGTLRFRDEILEPAQQRLGQVAAGLMMEFNAIHSKGYDLNGNAGGSFFAFSGTAVLVINNARNQGNALVTADFQDPNLTPSAAANLDYSDFSLKYVNAGNGVDYTLTRMRDGQVINLTATETSVGSGVYRLSPTSSSAVLPGIQLTVDLSGGKNVAVGDQFVAKPTYSAAQKIGIAIDDPRKIAAATNIEVDPVSKKPVAKLDANGVPVLDSLGNPVYVISQGPMPGDNRNALQLADLSQKLGMLGGTATFADSYAQMVSGVGSLTQSADLSASAQQALLTQAKSTRESLSGVSLDEEAANLLKYQQAYQASAQSISIAKSLFDTLIGAVR